LVLSILQAIQEAKSPLPGDDDLGCAAIRAVHTMAERLGRIDPAPVFVCAPISTTEQIAGEWLLGDRPHRLLPLPLLEKLAESISRLLPMEAHPMNRTGEMS